jgi:hypothetical protein
VASFLHGDSYAPGVLSARANMRAEKQGVMTSPMSTSNGIAHVHNTAPLHSAVDGVNGGEKSIKPRYDPGMGR